jgi:hypothetical protein
MKDLTQQDDIIIANVYVSKTNKTVGSNTLQK